MAAMKKKVMSVKVKSAGKNAKTLTLKTRKMVMPKGKMAKVAKGAY